MWFDTLVSLFSAPVTTGTALIVSLLTLLGVLLNLRHARKQAREEREFDTKRDLYLTVCEGMAAGAKYLAKFADFSLEPKEHEQIVAAFGKVHGVHLIASQASLKELINVYEFFVQSVFEIQSKRLPA